MSEHALDKPCVTVVVPTRDRQETLRTALDSVAAQTVPVELVVVDEGSDPPVPTSVLPPGINARILRHEHPVGPAAARNAGARCGSAPFVAFLDDDDYWFPSKLARCLEVFNQFPAAGVVVHRMRFAGSEAEGDGDAQLLTDGVRRMLLQQPPHVDAVLVRRTVHDVVGFDEGFPAAADLDYMLRLAFVAKIAQLNEVLGEHAPPNEGVSQITLDRRIAGRRLFLLRHRPFFDPPAMSFYWMRMGHIYRRAGQRIRAAGCFLRSLLYRPTSAHAWKGLAVVFLPGAVTSRRMRQTETAGG